jgi:hypothetical protein
LDRNGNPDFVAGGPDGDNLMVAIDQQTGTTESLDEMVVTGYNSITMQVINPSGFVISPVFQTVAGADYWCHDVDDDGDLDEESYDYNLEYGEYTIIIDIRPGELPNTPLTIGIRIDGTAQVRLANLLTLTMPAMSAPSSPSAESDSMVFYYTVEEIPSVRPANGAQTHTRLPMLDWTILAAQEPAADSFQVQLDRDYYLGSPIYDTFVTGQARFAVPDQLDIDSVYYWRYRSYIDGSPSDYSRTFALYIGDGCCVHMRGNANNDPDDKVNVSDVTYLIDYLFGIPTGPAPSCWEEGNANGDPDKKVNISDVTYVLAYLFGIPTGPPPPVCP